MSHKPNKASRKAGWIHLASPHQLHLPQRSISHCGKGSGVRMWGQSNAFPGAKKHGVERNTLPDMHPHSCLLKTHFGHPDGQVVMRKPKGNAAASLQHHEIHAKSMLMSLQMG